MICRLCRVTEKMETFDPKKFVIEDSDKKIQLVASVSYDRTKGQFKDSKGLGDVFGQETAAQMQQAQSGSANARSRAQQKFDQAKKGNTLNALSRKK